MINDNKKLIIFYHNALYHFLQFFFYDKIANNPQNVKKCLQIKKNYDFIITLEN